MRIPPQVSGHRSTLHGHETALPSRGRRPSVGCCVRWKQRPDAACPALNRTSINLMVEELVVMRLGSLEMQQKRKIWRITMQNWCIIILPGRPAPTLRNLEPQSKPTPLINRQVPEAYHPQGGWSCHCKAPGFSQGAESTPKAKYFKA